MSASLVGSAGWALAILGLAGSVAAGVGWKRDGALPPPPPAAPATHAHTRTSAHPARTRTGGVGGRALAGIVAGAQGDGGGVLLQVRRVGRPFGGGAGCAALGSAGRHGSAVPAYCAHGRVRQRAGRAEGRACECGSGSAQPIAACARSAPDRPPPSIPGDSVCHPAGSGAQGFAQGRGNHGTPLHHPCPTCAPLVCSPSPRAPDCGEGWGGGEMVWNRIRWLGRGLTHWQSQMAVLRPGRAHCWYLWLP